ncbi:MAG: hypothetical protein GY702_10540, partial [Desulfobulbaceae bacterium]|nr:hypothetical protein [Desulfobulbaceae bacterium]
MKMICPHCGVSGSADDSLLGRKVKCPKCTGIFEVVADIAQPISLEETDIEELLENDILSGIDENSMGGGLETGDDLDDSEPEDLFGEESLADNDEDIVEESLFEGGSIEDEELALQDTLSGE